ncbi:O-antigen ligase family protein [Sphingoaurantiacus capsulatus]|uniref:O-antigen ligase family protein n=1 Tax=Sphingoaurantiacus capsulatus TaxID=1771310 RepID=A0ABV7XCX5_9SPHN
MAAMVRPLLLALLVLAPLPFGANRPFAWSLIALLAGLMLVARARALQDGASLTWHRALWVPFGIAGAVTLWAVVQTFVPAGAADPLWVSAQTALGAPVFPRLGFAPDAALTGILRWLSYIGVFWLALQLSRDSDRAWALLRWLAWASIAYAAYGLITYLSGNDWLLWFPRWAYHDDLTSTFVNRNSYATYAAIGVLICATLAIRAFRTKYRLSDRSMARSQRLVDAFIGSSLAYTLAALLVAMAWLQTHSRMGFAAGATGMLAFLLLARGMSAGARALTFVLLLGVAGFLIAVSGGGTIARLEATQTFDRAELFEQVIRGIETAPWTGYGLGSFPSLFPMFRAPGFASGQTFPEAHNSYLELAFELGIPAAVAIVVAFVWLTAFNLRGALTRQRDALIPTLGVATSVVVGVHAITDFSAQMPAVAVTYAALLGIATAQSWSLASTLRQLKPANRT